MILKHFVELLSSMWINKSSVTIENLILEDVSSQYLTSLDPETLSLQSTFASFKSSRSTYVEALAFFATKFTTSELEKNLRSYLRSCLQVLITYSLCTSDNEWIWQKGIVNFEKHALTLEKLLPMPRISVSDQISLHNCFQHANLLEAKSKLSLLRVSVIRMLFDLNDTMEPNVIYKPFDFKNQEHARNAVKFHERMKIRSQPHSLTSNAFSFVINPPHCSDASPMSPPPYPSQRKVTDELEDENTAWWG